MNVRKSQELKAQKLARGEVIYPGALALQARSSSKEPSNSSQEVRQTPNAGPPTLEFPPKSKRPAFRLYKVPFLSKGAPYKAGVYWHCVQEQTNEEGQKEQILVDLWICSVLEVRAIVRTGSGREHSYLIEYIPHGETAPRYEVLSQAALLGRAEDALKTLRDIGVSVLHQHAKLIQAYLDSQHLRFGAEQPEHFWESVKTIGWHGERTFVLPHEIIGVQNKTWFAGKGDVAEYGKRGTLDSWRTRVALPCQDNPYLMVGLSLSICGPLLELLGIPGIGLHYYGDSTTGKTTAIFVGISAWSSPKFLLTWNGTANGLESQAASRSSTLIALDESHLAEARHLDAAIYLLLNGVSKNRMSRDAAAKAILRWFAAIFSSGERSTQTHLTGKTTEHKAGQGVRMIDMPIIARTGLGIFDCLNGCSSPKAFSEYLTSAAALDYGFAGPAFVQYLIDHRESLDLPVGLSSISTSMLDGDCLSAQQSRVLRSFALIALAGELAVQAGIFPWPVGSVKSAVKTLFDIWLSHQPQSATSREHAQILKKVSDFIEAHIDSRFSNINWTPSPNKYGSLDEPLVVYNRAGYWEEIADKKIALFTSGGLREATQGFDFGRVLRALEQAGAFYATGSGGEKAKKRRLPASGEAKLYHIDPEKVA
jgi:putative DNA primase/helicase